MCVSDQHQSAPSVVFTTIKNSWPQKSPLHSASHTCSPGPFRVCLSSCVRLAVTHHLISTDAAISHSHPPLPASVTDSHLPASIHSPCRDPVGALPRSPGSLSLILPLPLSMLLLPIWGTHDTSQEGCPVRLPLCTQIESLSAWIMLTRVAPSQWPTGIDMEAQNPCGGRYSYSRAPLLTRWSYPSCNFVWDPCLLPFF